MNSKKETVRFGKTNKHNPINSATQPITVIISFQFGSHTL